MTGEPHEAPRRRMVLRYFDEIVPVERGAIDARRTRPDARVRRREIGPPRPLPGDSPEQPDRAPEAVPAPLDLANTGDVRLGGDDPPDPERTRPRPEPRDLTGLALSGGGIRSAAYCLGVLQALEQHRVIDGLDYLSTVSGGGYIGVSMTVAMSAPADFPFLIPNDPRDTPALGHIRNYSNYLMPRATSGVRNLAEAAVILLRGILANAVLVASVLVGMALLTNLAYPAVADFKRGSFLLRLLLRPFPLAQHIPPDHFGLTLGILALLLLILLEWVVLRSGRIGAAADNDADSPMLVIARIVLLALLGIAFLDLQPVLIEALARFYRGTHHAVSLKAAMAAAAAFVSAMAGFSGKIGQFLKATERSTSRSVLAGRLANRALILLAGLVLPLLLLLVYLHLAAWGTKGLENVVAPSCAWIARYYWPLFLVTFAIGSLFKPNSYSLNQLYRDRLSKAFLFDPRAPETRPADRFKLSRLDTLDAPYQLINAAMNVQGSLAANQRGREADFFTFTRHFVGSDLTLYAPTDEQEPGYAQTADMEDEDPMLDVARAMAISGAAFSANMGSSTIRPLSPTLALLNVRLGYWLRNPRDLAKPRRHWYSRPLSDLYHRTLGKLYLLLEMLNMLDETSARIYLSDGGHIENLGVYELLKRGCQLIVAVDAECDPDLAFGSLVKMERFARIDLGIRIDLPWEEIAAADRRYRRSGGDAPTPPAAEPHGPHCAIGRILYADGSEGILFYVKSSLTGDETDYVLDYANRNPSFPHETTGDQFFSEEQFEAYRALGFHAVDRALDEVDGIALSAELRARNITVAEMLAWIRQMVSM